MAKLAMIWQLTEAEKQNLASQGRTCEAPACSVGPEFVLMIDRQPTLVVYACEAHAKAWAEDDRPAPSVSAAVE
jgi:hypothetical protein